MDNFKEQLRMALVPETLKFTYELDVEVPLQNLKRDDKNKLILDFNSDDYKIVAVRLKN